ncbi:uncharacterized protein ACBR49_001938 isoform 2-T2 [Aulostomus maculatus]
MMPNLGPKKRENPSRMDRNTEDVPQLSNEMQLSIMNMVKSGQLSIEDALNQAWKDQDQMSKKQAEEEHPQYNFSVHKHGRYRWQKRVLQIDFKTKMLCSIEKGIVRRQLPFSIVKSCDDGVGSRFSISLKGHHDYELEATSLVDKHKMMQLVNEIIYGNIYSDSGEQGAEMNQQPQASQILLEGVLLLHRGGLASFKWVKYVVQLHPDQLTLTPFSHRAAAADSEVTSMTPMSIVVHLSDGDTSVKKPQSSDTFTLVTHKNKYQFKMPPSDETTAPGALQRERDAWVQAIDKLCSNWKKESLGENVVLEMKTFRHLSIAEDAEDTDTDLDSRGGNVTNMNPPVENTDPISAGDTGQSCGPDQTTPVPKPRAGKTDAGVEGEDPLPSVPPPTSPVPCPPTSPPPGPSDSALTPSSTVQETLNTNSGSSVKEPPPTTIPPPPPLPFKLRQSPMKSRTKAFHWDLVSSDKIAKSFWKQVSGQRIEIDTSRLQEQFGVKNQGTFGVTEPSNTQHIMLNQKIAHNFNIFLKSFPVQPGELKDKLFIVNEEDGGLSVEHITSLRRYVPTLDDVEMFKSYRGHEAELHIVDQYMMEMCNIPCLSTQLDLLLTLRELPISMNDLKPLINQKIRMCTQLHNCGSLVSVLEYLLAIGNYLNENAGKEKAKGFRLSSLAKLSQLRGGDRKFTLLHALVEQIMLHEPRLAAFTHELAEFETVPGASIKGLTAEIDVLKNELQKVIQYGKTSKKRLAGSQANFSRDLKAAIEQYNTDLQALTKTCEEMKKLYSVILVKFGEPADQDSRELFGMICQFIHEFRMAHADVI